MTEKIEKEFFDRFDFVHTTEDPQKDLLAFGFECDDGWKDILWNLFEQIEKELSSIEDSEYQFTIIQVKEKYASLRVYTNWETDKISDLIEDAEKESVQTCEICGKRGVVRELGWWKTLCDEHFEEIENENKRVFLGENV